MSLTKDCYAIRGCYEIPNTVQNMKPYIHLSNCFDARRIKLNERRCFTSEMNAKHRRNKGGFLALCKIFPPSMKRSWWMTQKWCCKRPN